MREKFDSTILGSGVITSTKIKESTWNGQHSDSAGMSGIRWSIEWLTGIKLAPLFLPWARRMEALAAHEWMASFLFMGPICLFLMLYLFIFTKLWWLPLLYSVYYFYDRGSEERGGRKIEWVRNWEKWRRFSSYFPLTIQTTATYEPNRNYLFGYHPHGVLTCGAFGHFATNGTGFNDLFPGLSSSLVTIPYHFKFPLYREYAMAVGMISCTKRSISHVLSSGVGKVVCLVVGGARESLDNKPGSVTLHLTKRKGFIRLAIESGAALVPVFSFGESEVFDQVPNPPHSRLRAFQEWFLARTSFAPCFVRGRSLFCYNWGFGPQRRHIHTVVGKPILVTKTANAPQDLVDSVHQEYLEKLKELYYQHRHRHHSYKDVTINIV